MLPEDERPQPQPKSQPQQQQLLMPLNVDFGDENIFPEDIMFEILSRLPVRHLLRLRCVCKSWRALIDNAHFIRRHYEVQCSICRANKDVPIISHTSPLDSWEFELCVSVLSKQNGDIPVDLTADLVHDSAASFTIDDRELFNLGHFGGAVNGIVGFLWGFKNLGLWNPATRDFMAIPPWQTPCISYQFHEYNLGLIGFGYDSISNDFKVLREVRGQENVLLSYEVYSLATKSWKKLNQVLPLVFPFNGARFMKTYLNGVCYWYSGCTKVIISFNFSTEVFEVFNPPQNAFGSDIGYKYDWEMTTYKDSLAYVVTRTDLGKAVSNFDVWVVTEFDDNSGIPAAWQHLLTFGPFPSSDDLTLCAIRADGNVFFHIRPIDSYETYSGVYNPSTGMLKHLGFLLFEPQDYVESLFPLSKRLVQS